MADSVWSCKKEEFGSACEGLPLDYEHEGKEYCVLHFPSGDKDLAAFEEAIERKLYETVWQPDSPLDFNFRAVYFPGKQDFASFLPHVREAAFMAAFQGPVDFSGATFEGDADFSDVIFEGKADFSKVTFEGDAEFSPKGPPPTYETEFQRMANFAEASFKGRADFSWAFFTEARFSNATFEKRADFSGAAFQGPVDFSGATFKEEGKFWHLRTSYGMAPPQTLPSFESAVPYTVLSFESAVIEKAEKFSFHSTHLRPSWFIDVDAQTFDFSDVEWFMAPDGDELKLETEIAEIQDPHDWGFERPTRPDLPRFQKTCLQLMKNAEENRDYPTANEFHYWSMELLRKESWWRRLGLIGTLYWLLSGYGERPRRAFWVLVGMWALFAILYMVWGGQQLRAFSAIILLHFIDFVTLFWEPSFAILFAQAYSLEMQALSASEIQQSIEHAWKSLVYSLAAMARLNPEPKPTAPGVFQLLVTAQGLLGPLQIALLALAVRRRVMR